LVTNRACVWQTPSALIDATRGFSAKKSEMDRLRPNGPRMYTNGTDTLPITKGRPNFGYGFGYCAETFSKMTFGPVSVSANVVSAKFFLRP